MVLNEIIGRAGLVGFFTVCVSRLLKTSGGDFFPVAGDVGNENDQRLVSRNLRLIPIVDRLILH